MAKSVTMGDIASQLDVSIVTVSKALGNKEGVSEELREKVIQLANELGYIYNVTAKQKAEQASYSIGIVIHEKFMDDRGNSFYWKLYQNISRILKQKNCYAVLELLDEVGEENIQISKIVTEGKIDGLILLGQISETYTNALCNRDIPTLLLDFYNRNENYDSIISDSFHGSYSVTNHLIANGHRSIAFVGNIQATSSILDRYLGYCKSLIEHGIEVKKEYVLNDRNKEGKFTDILLPEIMPTAFVCNCDEVAYNLISKLKRIGMDIPRDVSVVGFDNYIISELMDPPLTTVEVDVDQMAKVAVDSIIRKIKYDIKHIGRRIITNHIVYRDSVRDISNL